jgi:predicted MFS family arabinose efflux permease
MFGLLIGGWVNEFFGWRLTFAVVGLPGVLLAVIVWHTVKDLPQASDRSASRSRQAQGGVGDVFRFLWLQRSFRWMALAASVHTLVSYGINQWYPAFFMRSFGISTGELGTYLALVLGLFGGIGTYLGGYWGDRLGARDPRWYLWLPLVATVIATPFYLGVFLASSMQQALLFMIAPTLLTSIYAGPVFAMAQGLVPASMRATAAAILLFVCNIIGLGLGPQLVGVLSDLLRPAHDVDSLRYALLVVSALTLLGSALFGYAARYLRRDLEHADEVDSGLVALDQVAVR